MLETQQEASDMTTTEPQNGTPVRSPRKGARVGPVSELSVFLKVKPGREQLIREVFHMTPAQRAAMEKAIYDVGSLHQARYVLFDNGTRLLIATTFDGDWDVYIDDFAASYILDAWDAFLIHCEGYPDEGKASLTSGGDQGVPHREPGHGGRLLHARTRGLRRRRSRRRCALSTAFQQVLDTPGAAEALQTPGPEAAAGAGGQLTPSPSPGWRRAGRARRHLSGQPTPTCKGACP